MAAPPPVAADPDVQVGDVLAGRYRLVRLLGEGGMGTVWEARQVTTDKAVALKLLKRGDASDTARFLREARLAAALSHRNIVQVFDYWEVEGGGPAFIVMELLGGETLASKLERVGRLPCDEVLAVAVPVASALRTAHAQGVIHRDLKPENVFLSVSSSEPGAVEVKVVDFGLARPTVPDAAATAITQSGAVMGTPYYMAPEQVYGDKDVDGRADVWALGTVIWECIAGTKTFAGDNFGQIFRRISHADMRPLSEVAPETPAWLGSLVTRMLSHDRDGRPSMAEVHEALVHQTNEPIAETAPALSSPQATVRLPSPSVTPNAATQPLPPAATRLTASTSVRLAAGAPPHRGPAVRLGAIAVAVVAIGAAAMVVLPKTKSPPVAVQPEVAPSTLPVPAAQPDPPPSLTALPDPIPQAVASPAPAPPSSRRAPGRRALPSPSPSSSSATPSVPDPLGRGRF